MLHQETGGSLSSIKAMEAHLIDTTENTTGDIRKILPGAVAGKSDFLFPVAIQLDRPFKSIRVELTHPRNEVLNFSRLEFFGRDLKRPQRNKETDIINVSETANCTQSSNYKNLPDPSLGIRGIMFACNVHTNREHAPWWQADFPDHIKLAKLYFHHRMDPNGIRSEYLKISGIDEQGDSHTLYHPIAKEQLRQHTRARVKQVTEALTALRSTLTGTSLSKFDKKLTTFATQLASYLSKAKKHKPSTEDRQATTAPLLEALEIGLSKSPDFGICTKTAESIRVKEQSVRFVRVRSIGRNAPELGGIEIARDGRWFRTKKRTEGKTLPLGYRRAAHLNQVGYNYNLRQATRGQRVDFKKLKKINQLRVWNSNKHFAGRTSFTEIYVSPDGENWTRVFDNWQQFRNVIDALQLASILVKNDWTPTYARLLGKLFGLYRCQNMITPCKKMVRSSEELVRAFGEGTDIARGMVKHAPPMHLTKHGLQVPLVHRNTKRIMERFIHTRDVIVAAGYAPILLYGTLLGAIREKDFIAHDDDLDIAIIVDGIGKDGINDAKVRIAEELKQHGLPCRAGGTTAPIVHYRSKDVNIDIFILGKQGDTIYWPHKSLKIVPERADIFLPLSTIEFKGYTFAAPKDPVAVTIARYGTGWKTPEPLFEV